PSPAPPRSSRCSTELSARRTINLAVSKAHFFRFSVRAPPKSATWSTLIWIHHQARQRRVSSKQFARYTPVATPPRFSRSAITNTSALHWSLRGLPPVVLQLSCSGPALVDLHLRCCVNCS